jgi:hypothetical protein
MEQRNTPEDKERKLETTPEAGGLEPSRMDQVDMGYEANGLDTPEYLGEMQPRIVEGWKTV